MQPRCNDVITVTADWNIVSNSDCDKVLAMHDVHSI